MIWHETRFVFLWLGLHQDILVASSSTSYCICTTIPNLTQNTLPLSLSHTPLHFEVSALISLSLSLKRNGSHFQFPPLSHSLSVSQQTQNQKTLTLTVPELSLSLASIYPPFQFHHMLFSKWTKQHQQPRLTHWKEYVFFHISEFKFSPFCTKLKKKKSLFSKFNSWSFSAEYPAFPTVMDINQIREILPHRWVFVKVFVFVLCVFCVFLMNSFFWWWGVVGFHFC